MPIESITIHYSEDKRHFYGTVVAKGKNSIPTTKRKHGSLHVKNRESVSLIGSKQMFEAFTNNICGSILPFEVQVYGANHDNIGDCIFRLNKDTIFESKTNTISNGNRVGFHNQLYSILEASQRNQDGYNILFCLMYEFNHMNIVSLVQFEDWLTYVVSQHVNMIVFSTRTLQKLLDSFASVRYLNSTTISPTRMEVEHLIQHIVQRFGNTCEFMCVNDSYVHAMDALFGERPFQPPIVASSYTFPDTSQQILYAMQIKDKSNTSLAPPSLLASQRASSQIRLTSEGKIRFTVKQDETVCIQFVGYTNSDTLISYGNVNIKHVYNAESIDNIKPLSILPEEGLMNCTSQLLIQKNPDIEWFNKAIAHYVECQMQLKDITDTVEYTSLYKGLVHELKNKCDTYYNSICEVPFEKRASLTRCGSQYCGI